MTREQKELEDFLGPPGGYWGIVENTNPGVWGVTWVQPEALFDPNDPPDEQCIWCGNWIEYYWVSQDWLYQRWGQERPFWLRVGCSACDEGKTNKGHWQSPEVIEGEIVE